MSMLSRPGRRCLALLVCGAAVVFGSAACSRPAPPVSMRPAALEAASCSAASLRLRVVGFDTVVGTTAVTVAVGTDSTSCSLQGYPTVTMLDAQSRPAPVPVGRGTGPMFAQAATAAVPVASGQEASFFLVYRTLVPATGAPCPPLSGLRVSLPGVAGQLVLAVQLSPCGAVSVSAIRAGANQE
jgi:Domain of unknown function (DUF4232)